MLFSRGLIEATVAAVACEGNIAKATNRGRHFPDVARRVARGRLAELEQRRDGARVVDLRQTECVLMCDIFKVAEHPASSSPQIRDTSDFGTPSRPSAFISSSTFRVDVRG